MLPAPAVKPSTTPSRHASARSSKDRVLADPDALRVLFCKGPGADPELAKIYCAVEIALYDLAGKAAGLPVSELLGGRVRDRIRLYGSAGMYMAPGGLCRRSRRHRRTGIQSLQNAPRRRARNRTWRPCASCARPSDPISISWWTPTPGGAWATAATPGHGGESGPRDGRLRHRVARRTAAARRSRRLPASSRKRTCVPLASGRARTERRALPGPDPDAGRRLCADGRVLPGRLLAGPPDLRRDRPRRAEASPSTVGARRWKSSPPPTWASAGRERWWNGWNIRATPAPDAPACIPFPLAAEILTEPLELDRGDLIVPRAPGLGVDGRRVASSSAIRGSPGPWSFFRTDSPAETRAVTADHSVPWSKG